MTEAVVPAVLFEDELDLKEEELLSASCKLIKMFPRIDRQEGDMTGRLFGVLDRELFLNACSAHTESEDESPETTRNRAEEAFQLWSNVVEASYLLVEHEDDDIPFKPYSTEALEELKEKLGLVLYRHVRKIFREVRVSVKLAVQFRPWNHEEGKEADLGRILTSLEHLRSENLETAFNNNNILHHRDFTEDDYELLLALDVNNHQHGGASTSRINNLPESTVQTYNVHESCVICLETQAIGETIRHLPCFHKFHKHCIDRWLRQSRLCPVCKEDVY